MTFYFLVGLIIFLIAAGSFVDLNIWERQHIEEWVRTNPEMLGEDFLIVSIEFDRFSNSNDRLDALAVDRSGNLVVIELKRDPASGYADLQAIPRIPSKGERLQY